MRKWEPFIIALFRIRFVVIFVLFRMFRELYHFFKVEFKCSSIPGTKKIKMYSHCYVIRKKVILVIFHFFLSDVIVLYHSQNLNVHHFQEPQMINIHRYIIGKRSFSSCFTSFCLIFTYFITSISKCIYVIDLYVHIHTHTQ